MIDYKRTFTESELTERINLLWSELEKQCAALNSDEFEYSWEMWGVMWTPWFIMVGDKSINFSANNLESADFDILVKQGKLEIVKIYEAHELKEEFEKIRYRIVKKHS
ncbi:hypothetical protein [Flavobacterium anhuiense]|uniref:hypothetical protein n=1 Tax=Flavobacterium anhuiense TaxID=459526 RepID=UPI003D951C5E